MRINVEFNSYEEMREFCEMVLSSSGTVAYRGSEMEPPKKEAEDKPAPKKPAPKKPAPKKPAPKKPAADTGEATMDDIQAEIKRIKEIGKREKVLKIREELDRMELESVDNMDDSQYGEFVDFLRGIK